MSTKRERVKAYINDHLVVFSVVGGATIAGFTYIIMKGRCVEIRGVSSQSISPGIAVTAKRGIAVLGKRVVISNVSFISSNRQGPPSWVIRCKETGEIFASQNAASLSMGLPQNEISRHLNGLRDNVRGNTFERICMAA